MNIYLNSEEKIHYRNVFALALFHFSLRRMKFYSVSFVPQAVVSWFSNVSNVFSGKLIWIWNEKRGSKPNHLYTVKLVEIEKMCFVLKITMKKIRRIVNKERRNEFWVWSPKSILSLDEQSDNDIWNQSTNKMDDLISVESIERLNNEATLCLEILLKSMHLTCDGS